MASFSCTGLDDFILRMEEIATLPEAVIDDMLNAQADVLVEAQRREGMAMGVQSQGGGQTLKSIKKGKVKTKKGQRAIYVTPSGTRKRGKKRVRNAEIAFINEYGKKGQKARPFIRVANEKSAKQTTQAAMEVYDQFLKSKNL